MKLLRVDSSILGQNYTQAGPQGLAGGKKIIVVSSRGGVYQADDHDFQEGYLRRMFGFLDISDVEIVRAEGLPVSPQHRADGLPPHTRRSGLRCRRRRKRPWT